MASSPAPRPAKAGASKPTGKATPVKGGGSKAVAATAVTPSARSVKRAEKARKRASTDPADMGRVRQIVRAYQLTHEYDKQLPYLMIGVFVGAIVVFWAFHFVWNHPIYLSVLGALTGLMLAMMILVRRAKAATYRRYSGQAGSAEVALGMLSKQWVSKPVIAVTRQRDVVHRTLGPGGLVLIGEGDPNRLRPLLASEVKKHERVAYGVKVLTITMGSGQGQVPLDRLADHLRKLPKVLQPNEITDIRARLRALDAVRPQLPMPKGPVPTNPRQVRGARQSTRGR